VTLLLAALAAVTISPKTAETPELDPAAVQSLVRACKESDTWGLVVMLDGKVVLDRNFGHPNACNLMSATKSVTSMAIGLLIDEGKISSVDAPVASYLPEFRGKWKDRVTIRHILTHTSGLRIYDDPDEDLTNRVSVALKAPIVTEPGATFAYNNRAVDLLSGLVRKVSGEPLDKYLDKRLFKPLGIHEFYWVRDPDGNPHGCAELVLRPRDFAKIGQLMLDEGVWRGRRILSKEYVRQATTSNGLPQPYPYTNRYGWLWWLSDPWMTLSEGSLDYMKSRNVPDTALRRLRPLVGQRWPSMREMWFDIIATAGPCPELEALSTSEPNEIQAIVKDSERVDGFYAAGWGGQYLFVLPKRRLVAVRTGGSGFFPTKEPAKYEMGSFYRLVTALVPN
jgi:CubicO group peptidase (beta-lactamase class C family)